MTQPAVPARPQAAPLPPATRRPLPGPPQPGSPQPGPGQSARPQPGPAPSYPPPAYQRPAYEQRPQAPQDFESFRPYQPPVPPSAGGPPPGPPRQPPRRHDGRRAGSSLTLWIILLVLLVGGGVAGLLIAHPFSHPALRETAGTGTSPAAPGGSSAGPAAGGPTSGGPVPASPATSASAASATTPPSAPAVTEQQAATSLDTMLSQSVSDRAAIISAANDVSECGPSLNSDPKVFDDAASSRKSLLARFTAMPGRAALPAALVSDLTQAWQASIAADQAYAKWANDEITQGCVANDTSDPGYQATLTPNANATQYKTAFVAQWNPVAARYGLTPYQQDQL